MGAKLMLTLMLKVAVIVPLLYGLSGSQSLVAQTPPSTQSEDQTAQRDGQRGDMISADFFTDSRPSGKNTRPAKSRYRDRRAAGPQRTAPKGAVHVRLGVTLGRGRAATEEEIKDSSIAKVNTCVERQANECRRWRQMVVERVSDDTAITHGTPIQMMIEYLASRDSEGTKQESNRVGYLYVVNRVEFKDRLPSPPKLIYPTEQTFGGDNRVLPGKTVILPNPQRLWEITRNRDSTQEFETYTIIISPEPLKDLKGEELRLGKTSVELEKELVRNWVNQWGGGEIQSDLEGGAGQLFTKREQSAGGDPSDPRRDTDEMDADLKPNDPAPQMGFRKAVTPSGTMLITIKLPFKEATATVAPKP